MAQTLLDDLGMEPLLEHPRGCGVPQIVEAYVGQAHQLQIRMDVLD